MTLIENAERLEKLREEIHSACAQWPGATAKEIRWMNELWSIAADLRAMECTCVPAASLGDIRDRMDHRENVERS